jgi:hypothetical protein
MPVRHFGDNRGDRKAGDGKAGDGNAGLDKAGLDKAGVDKAGVDKPVRVQREPRPGDRLHRLRSRTLLVEYLDALGYSGRSFAREAGLGHATVNHLLTGRRGTCSRGTADRIEATLHCPPGLLFEGRRR